MELLYWLSIIIFILTFLMILEIVFGLKKMTNINKITPLEMQDAPKVSIIVPACNEESTIEPALQSMLQLDYPNFEIIIVNDRSTDNTYAILKQVKNKNPNIKLKNISELPNGWMGKTHALHSAAQEAEGEYLLFTDADIIMEKSLLSRAMQHIISNKLDHLSIFFKLIAQGGLLHTLYLDAISGILLLKKPWKIKEPGNNHYMGIGAFNLVKSSAYKAINGHADFSMHPIDDIMLGKALKKNGYVQDCIFGQQFIQVKWYATVGEYINGLMKNTFAFYHYSLMKVIFTIFAVVILNILPFWGFLFSSGYTQLFFGVTIVMRILLYVHLLLNEKLSPWYSLWTLVSPYINIFIIIKSAFTTIFNKGITWRGTFYSFSELKMNENV